MISLPLLMIHVTWMPLQAPNFHLKGMVFWFIFVQHTYLSMHTTVHTYRLAFLAMDRLWFRGDLKLSATSQRQWCLHSNRVRGPEDMSERLTRLTFN
jgi:hypothetical protein